MFGAHQAGLCAAHRAEVGVAFHLPMVAAAVCVSKAAPMAAGCLDFGRLNFASAMALPLSSELGVAKAVEGA